MGVPELIRDCIAHSTTLAEKARKSAGQVDDIERVIASVQSQLQDSVQTGQQALKSLQARVVQMEADLNGFMKQILDAMGAGLSQVGAMQSAVQQDAERVDAMESMVKDSVAQLTAMVGSLTQEVEALRQQEKAIIKALEARVAESEATVKDLRQLAEETRASFDQRRGRLDADYTSLQKTLATGHDRMYADYTQEVEDSKQGLAALERQVKASSDKTFGDVRTGFVDDSGQKLNALSKDLTQTVGDLRHICDKPQDTADTVLVELKSRLDKTQEPLQNVAATHQQGRNLDLISAS